MLAQLGAAWHVLAQTGPARGRAPACAMAGGAAAHALPYPVELRDYDTAAHEAAHVVVGVAVGLRMRRAIVGVSRSANTAGEVWFEPLRGSGPRRREALALMYAAGIAWDRMTHAPTWWSAYDRAELRLVVSGRHGYATMVRAATALLGGLAAEHGRVTRALLDRDLTGPDIAAMARGDDPDG